MGALFAKPAMVAHPHSYDPAAKDNNRDDKAGLIGSTLLVRHPDPDLGHAAASQSRKPGRR